MSDQAGAYPLVPPATGSGDGSFWMPIRVTADTEDCVTGSGIVSFHFPFACNILEVAAGCAVAPTGSAISVDPRNAGASITISGVDIDATERWSGDSASYPFALDSPADVVTAGAVGSITVNSVGSTTPGKGLIVYLKLEPQ